MKSHSPLFERRERQYAENRVHCLTTAGTTFAEIHPLLIKYARSVEEKLITLLFQREWRKHVENYFCC